MVVWQEQTPEIVITLTVGELLWLLTLVSVLVVTLVALVLGGCIKCCARTKPTVVQRYVRDAWVQGPVTYQDQRYQHRIQGFKEGDTAVLSIPRRAGTRAEDADAD